ncbi:type I toxin-antitoxin system Fst family toxin [Ligilactobacillus aviarius]|nr:type I toxin-antitoxin system Fst family toxin [Ligilactobacillus aviarius]
MITFLFKNILAPLLVGCLVAIFTQWINKR